MVFSVSLFLIYIFKPPQNTATNLPVSITHHNHLLQQLPIRGGLGYNFPEHQQQFLDHVILHRYHKLDHCHQNPRQPLTVQDKLDYLFQCTYLALDIIVFWCGKDIIDGTIPIKGHVL